MRASIHTAIATVLVGATSVAAYATAPASNVGSVETVERSAYGTPPNASKESKHRGDAVAYQELLETMQKSGMLVRFSDGSKLTLGANSKVLVDAFVYEPGNAGSKALISLPAGALRYVTGAMPKGQTTIETPTATMVLRGTNVKVVYGVDNVTHLVVDEGSVKVHNTLTGEDTIVDEGQSVDISNAGTQSSEDDEAGDTVVDDGFKTPGGPGTIPEQRRTGERNKQQEPTRRESPGGGGGSTPG